MKSLDYQQIEERITSWLRTKVAAASSRGVLVGLSGGIDSAVVAVLMKKAFPAESLGLIMPCHSLEQDQEDAEKLAQSIDLDYKIIDLSQTYDALLRAAAYDPGPGQAKELSYANVKPRLRMTSLYLEGSKRNYLVVGTGNKSEFVTGYFTKYGDGGVDLEPLGELLKTEVAQLARHLKIDPVLIDKAPSGGLWQGQTDEKEMGFSYQALDDYIEGKDLPEDLAQKIDTMIKKSQHKKHMPPFCPVDDIRGDL